MEASKNLSSGSEDFLEEISDFSSFGRNTERQEIGGIPYFINEFWTAGQRQAHSIHEVSYRACFKAQLPGFFISRLTRPGDSVHDPFMGRGTTPVQAALMDRKAFGNDINPLSVLLTRPRLKPIRASEVSRALEDVDLTDGKVRREELLAFYHPETLRGLESLKQWLAVAAPPAEPAPEPIADWIRMVAINRLSGHSPGFFSGRSMPPNQAISVASQLRINEKLGVNPPPRDIPRIIRKKTISLLKDGTVNPGVSHSLHTGPAWNTPGIPDGSVDLVVTSPPFLDVVHYASDNWLRCWFAGIDPATVKIAMHKTAENWLAMVHDVLREQARILRPGGHVAFEVGEVRKGKILLEKWVWRAAEGLPFERLGVMVNDQNFTKTANCWGVANGTKGTNTNRIVLLRRH